MVLDVSKDDKHGSEMGCPIEDASLNRDLHPD